MLSERRTQFADERRSEVKYQTLSIASIATNRLAGLLRFGSTHCYPTFDAFGSTFTSRSSPEFEIRVCLTDTVFGNANISSMCASTTDSPEIWNSLSDSREIAVSDSEDI